MNSDWTISAATPTRPLAFIVRYVRRRPFPMPSFWPPCWRRRLLGHDPIRREDAWSMPLSPDPRRRCGVVRLYAAGFADRRRQSVVAGRRLDRQLSPLCGVTGDLRRDLFRHLTGHSPSYFADRLPGMLTSRITATSNAVFTIENMFVWNVLPPCVATLGAIALRRHRQRADGGWPRGDRRRRHGRRDVPPGGGRQAAASRFRRQGRRRRRRDGRRHRQYAAGPGVLRHAAASIAASTRRSTAR